MQRFVKLSCFLTFILGAILNINGQSINTPEQTLLPNVTTIVPETNGTSNVPRTNDTTTDPSSTTTDAQNSTNPVEQDWFFLKIDNKFLLYIIAGLLVVCVLLMITSLRLACKVHDLKYSKHYQVRSNTEPVPTLVSSSTRDECVPGDAEPTETCLMMNENSKPEEEENRTPGEETGTTPGGETGTTPGEISSLTPPDPLIEEETPTMETLSYQGSKVDQNNI